MNLAITNYSAYPVEIEGVCHYLIILCNRKSINAEIDKLHPDPTKSHLSFDDLKLVNFVIYSFQSVVSQIKTIEQTFTGEYKYKQLAKVERIIMRS